MPGMNPIEQMAQMIIGRIYPGSVTAPKGFFQTMNPASTPSIREVTLETPSGSPIIMCGKSKCGDGKSVCG